MTEIVRTRSTLTAYLTGATGRTRYEFKRHAIQRSLYGVDIDPGAVEIAKLRLWLSLVVDEEDLRTINPLPNLDYKIVTGNSLLGVEKTLFNRPLFEDLEALKPSYFDESDRRKKALYKSKIDGLIYDLTRGREAFDFEIFFSEVFHRRGGFDVVIGNPPYVFGGNKGISAADKSAYKRLYRSGAGKINLFTLFIERGSQILRDRGALTFIVPNTLLRVTSYQNTRQYVLENMRVSSIVDLDVGVFDSVTASTIIVLFTKEHATPGWRAVVRRGCDDHKPTETLQADWKRRGYIFDIFSSGGDRGLYEKLTHGTVLLESLCARIRFGVVIAGNLDEVVSEKKRGARWKPFLEGDEISAYVIRYGGRYLHYEPALLHRSRTPDLFESRKIMIQRITGGETPLKATLDDEQYYNKESILNLILSSSAVTYEYVCPRSPGSEGI